MGFIGIGKKNYGKDYNFFQKIDVSNTDFADSPDVIITFQTQGVMLLNETSGVIEYSFNGLKVHGEISFGTMTQGLIFDNRTISTIWFRVKTGSVGPITVRVDAWER